MANMIINSQTKLKDRLNELIPKSNNMKFLVGFFYFSGINELYESLKDKSDINIKILVGLNTESIVIAGVERAFEYQDDKKTNTKAVEDNYIKSLRNAFKEDIFDTKEFEEQFRFFLNLIKEDKIVIRKTQKPNHSKLYLFQLEDAALKKLFITGSSNLTKAGLNIQEEFNVQIMSDNDYDEAEEYFDNLWKDSIRLTENDAVKNKIIAILENETHLRSITPYETYVLSVKTYLETYTKSEIGKNLKDLLTQHNYKIHKYQEDAAGQALDIIKNHNGVIIADVVGLGKSVIASMVINQLPGRTLVIAPPGLVGDKQGNFGWEMYANQFEFYGHKVCSCGNLKEALTLCDNIKFENVLIDEAHRFRNINTESYETLSNICRNKKVILLTATPFNNSPNDLQALLRLFMPLKKSGISLNENIDTKFKDIINDLKDIDYIKKYYNSTNFKRQQSSKEKYRKVTQIDLGKEREISEADIKQLNKKIKSLSNSIKKIIEPVTIRRNRIDLIKDSEYSKDIDELSELHDPIEKYYELTKEQSDFYDDVLEKYFSENGEFNGAIYKPYLYDKKANNDDNEDEDEDNADSFSKLSQNQLFNFMRRLLVKRFESSFGSFADSMKRFKELNKKCLDFINQTNTYILDRKFMDELLGSDEDNVDTQIEEYEKKLKEKKFNNKSENKVYRFDNNFNGKAFTEAIQKDIELFDNIIKKINSLELLEKDPKFETLVKTIDLLLKKDPNRKIIIFSEYADTVKHLERKFEALERNGIMFVKNLTKTLSEEIISNFDASYPNNDSKYQIMVATDKMSEGYNLNLAGVIINYDIPWNPVRVIQRVGRINRISKKVYDKLYIYNFFPSEKGADHVHIKEIAEKKMFLIHNILGEDSKIFSPEEEPCQANLHKKLSQNPDLMEEESFYTRMKGIYSEMLENDPEIIESFENIANKVKTAKKYNKNEILVLIKKLGLYIKYKDLDNNTKEEVYSFEDMFENIKCNKNTARLEFSDNAWNEYQKLKKIKPARKDNPKGNSNEKQALTKLRLLKQDNYELKSLTQDNYDLGKHKKLIDALIKDIEEFGTLTNNVFKKIAAATPQELMEYFNELYQRLGGETYINLIENPKEIMPEIIIAIENQNI